MKSEISLWFFLNYLKEKLERTKAREGERERQRQRSRPNIYCFKIYGYYTQISVQSVVIINHANHFFSVLKT
jgi:hypothetical protein